MSHIVSLHFLFYTLGQVTQCSRRTRYWKPGDLDANQVSITSYIALSKSYKPLNSTPSIVKRECCLFRLFCEHLWNSNEIRDGKYLPLKYIIRCHFEVFNHGFVEYVDSYLLHQSSILKELQQNTPQLNSIVYKRIMLLIYSYFQALICFHVHSHGHVYDIKTYH